MVVQLLLDLGTFLAGLVLAGALVAGEVIARAARRAEVR